MVLFCFNMKDQIIIQTFKKKFCLLQAGWDYEHNSLHLLFGMNLEHK